MFISKIRNPFTVNQYGPFIIEIYDKTKALIARNDNSAYYRTKPGKMIDVSLDLLNKVVATKSAL